MEQQQAKFDGWAIVDVLGHQRHVGYVTTEHFGQSTFFRVATPSRDSRERIIEADGTEYVSFNACPFPPKGSTVREDGRPGSERLIGAGSIYMLTPQSRDEAIKLLDEIDPRPVLGVTLPDGTPVEQREVADIPF